MVRNRAGHAIADYAVSCGYVHMWLQLSAYVHIIFNMRKSAYWYMRFMPKMSIWVCLFRTAYVSAYTNKLWGIRSSLNMNEHSQFVQLTFSKSLIRSGGTLELTFHMSICVFSVFFCICGYPHIRIHYADFSMRFHADMRISICKNCNRIWKEPHGQL